MPRDFGKYITDMTVVEQAKFAERAGMNLHTVVYRYGKGKNMPHRNTVRALAEATQGAWTAEEIAAWFESRKRARQRAGK